MTLCTAKRFGKAKAIAPSPFYLVPTDERFSHGPYRACGAFFVGCAGRQENVACFFKFGTCCALSLPALSSPLPGRAAFLSAILRGSALDKNRRAIALAPNAAKKISPQEKLTQSRLSGSAVFWWKQAVRRKRGRVQAATLESAIFEKKRFDSHRQNVFFHL